jgi:squalene cyclase
MNTCGEFTGIRFLLAMLCGWLALGGAAPGGTLAASEPEDFFTPAVRQAIGRGLDYLAASQNDEGCFGTSGYRRNVAVVSLAGMAFMANGSTPGRGPYGEHVSGCVQYVLSRAGDSGYIFDQESASHGPMYGHGFSTLLLAEAYGMSPDAELRGKLAKAVNLIVKSQNEQGGWRYQPEPREADISVTICQVMALRAARNAGLYVPNATIDRCTEFVKRCQNADGGFSYMLPGGASMFPRSAAGVVALYSAGIYEGQEVQQGLKYLSQHLPDSRSMMFQNNFYYGHYYAVQAMWHARGEHWQRWYPAIRKTLLSLQTEEGYWEDQICREYGTAMACLILQMPQNYLPIFQR